MLDSHTIESKTQMPAQAAWVQPPKVMLQPLLLLRPMRKLPQLKLLLMRQLPPPQQPNAFIKQQPIELTVQQ